MKFLAIALAFLVGACTTMPATPAQSIYAAHAAYASVLTAAVAYESLPECNGRVAPCKNALMVETIRKADDVAYASLLAAQVAARTPGITSDRLNLAVIAATSAVATLQAVVNSLEVK